MIRYFKCAVCGKRSLDQSSAQNKRFCSSECRNAYHNKARSRACKFNEGVVCSNRACKTCGWNPEVAKKRALMGAVVL